MTDYDNPRLPSDKKGHWTGEKGNSVFVPHDEFLKKECKKAGVEGFRFENNRLNLDSFAIRINGKPLIGDIPRPSDARNRNPRSYNPGEKPEPIITKDGTIGDGFSKPHLNLGRTYAIFDNDTNMKIINRESVHGKTAVRNAVDASNYDQAFASVANNIGWTQKDVIDLVKVSRGNLSPEKRDRILDGISERNNISGSRLNDITAQPLSIHETMYFDSEGVLRAYGVIVSENIHAHVSHGGLVDEANRREKDFSE